MVSFTGWVALATFVAQNTAAALLMRYAKTRMEPYNSAVAVLLQEVALKLPISVVLFAVECGGFGQMVQKIRRDFSERPLEWAQLSVPALLYLVTNISVYVGYDNLEAALGMVMYQSKIVFTAIFSVTLLNKKISVNQWCAVFVLVLGVIAAQGLLFPQPAPEEHAHAHHGHGHGKHGGGRSLAAAAEKNRVVGMGAFLLAAVCTSFASVYFEKMIKSDSKPSLWLRNLQLAMYSGEGGRGRAGRCASTNLRPARGPRPPLPPASPAGWPSRRHRRRRPPDQRLRRDCEAGPAARLRLLDLVRGPQQRAGRAARRCHHQVRRQHPPLLRAGPRHRLGRRGLVPALRLSDHGAVHARRRARHRRRLSVRSPGQHTHRAVRAAGAQLPRERRPLARRQRPQRRQRGRAAKAGCVCVGAANGTAHGRRGGGALTDLARSSPAGGGRNGSKAPRPLQCGPRDPRAASPRMPLRRSARGLCACGCRSSPPRAPLLLPCGLYLCVMGGVDCADKQ